MHGIEINEFAVEVAKTALWIAELQASIETSLIIQRVVEDLPLKDGANIVHGNALQVDWTSVLDPAKCSFVMGNPPFIGYSNLTQEQKVDREEIFGKSGGTLDYVACWYRKAADYIEGTSLEVAFVSTNSICQGQQVTPLWQPLLTGGLFINFAHNTFVWANEATNQAHVHVVIVGFSYKERAEKQLFSYTRGKLDRVEEVEHINGYLAPAVDVFITRTSKPLCDVPAMKAGGKPTEGGSLLMWEAERDELLAQDPGAAKWIRPFSMGEEFINGKERYCLWITEDDLPEMADHPLVLERIRAVAEYRQKSTKKATQKKADIAWRFDEVKDPGETYIGVPKVSSVTRRYIPMGFVDNGMIPGDKLYFIPTDSLYVFGVMMSHMHNAWLRAVGGRLKSDYSYANTIIYNNFIWPDATEEQKQRIEACAQQVIEARSSYAGKSLKALYKIENEILYPRLTAAHRELDAAVEAAYGQEFHGDEDKMVAHLFQLYARHTGEGK